MKKTTLLNYFFSALLFIGFIPIMTAQLQNNNWYFGTNLGLNFSGTTPTEIFDSAMSSDGGSATVSDAVGNLLFYTNGENVWNKNHNLMLDGNNTIALLTSFGPSGASQSVVVVPKPDDAGKYYVFSNNTFLGLSYSIVDMNANGGLGAVEGTMDGLDKNIELQSLTGTSEKLTAILHPSENAYWLLSFGPDPDAQGDGIDDTFYAYKIDASGINNPIPSTFTDFSSLPTYTGGQMKISPDASKIAMVHNLGVGNSLFVFDFNADTGEVANLSGFVLPLIDDGESEYSIVDLYGVEFSPDSNFLYTSVINAEDLLGFWGGGNLPYGSILQIDYKNPNLGDQDGTGYALINDAINFEGGAFNEIYALQLRADGKIYAASGSGQLYVMGTPNIPDQGTNFSESVLFQNSLKDLPQLVPDIFVGKSAAQSLPKKPVLEGNPFKEEIKLKFKFIQTYTIELYNGSGDQPLGTIPPYEMKNRKIYKLDTNGLADGPYYLIIRDQYNQVWYTTAVKTQ